jgi:hypothetical protein
LQKGQVPQKRFAHLEKVVSQIFWVTDTSSMLDAFTIYFQRFAYKNIVFFSLILK